MFQRGIHIGKCRKVRRNKIRVARMHKVLMRKSTSLSVVCELPPNQTSIILLMDRRRFFTGTTTWISIGTGHPPPKSGREIVSHQNCL